MPSLADLQREVDAQIFTALGEVMLIGAVEVAGVFFKRPREIEATDGTFVGLDISFDCQITEEVAALERGDEVTIQGVDGAGNIRDLGTYRFQRRVPEHADESGLVTCALGYTA